MLSAHSIFICCSSGNVILTIYVDDILLTGSVVDGIKKAKKYLKNQFVTKDMDSPRYFLGIEIAHTKHIVFFSKEVCFGFTTRD